MKKFRKRLVAKEVARHCLLKRKVPNRVSRTLLKLPDIARDIESFARENRVGADSWRRTGVSTFSGNVKLCASRSTLKRNMVSILDMELLFNCVALKIKEGFLLNIILAWQRLYQGGQEKALPSC